MNRTSIAWTDYSWPVVNGCRRVSPGCAGCYAERLASTRLVKTPKYKGLAVFGKNGPRWTGETRLWTKDLDGPLKLRKPSRIFVADMGDLFYEGVTSDTIDAVFGVAAACPQHIFQILTKRGERMRAEVERMGIAGIDSLVDAAAEFIYDAGRPDLLAEGMQRSNGVWPLPNVHLGVSAEDQQRANERIPELLRTPAAVRFVSYEPALGPVDFKPWLPWVRPRPKNASAKLDWIIVGGESGPKARPFDVEWAHSTVDQCAAAGVACFVKQMGSAAVRGLVEIMHGDPRGGDPEEWPEDLRVREFPKSTS